MNINFVQEDFFTGEAERGELGGAINMSTEDEYMKSLDSTGDSFRIRLICTILDSLGKYF